MPIFAQLKDGRTVELPINVSPADDHRTYYAHGASGGIHGTYHYRVDFYQDIVPALRYKEVGWQG